MPGQSGGAVLQRQPVKPDKTPPLTLNIRIASSQNVVENADLSGPKKDLVKEISNDLRNQFLKHLQDRLAFLKSDKIKVTISFGQFADKDLKVAGNIQVWLVPELDQSFAAGAVMKKKYKYSDKAAQDVNAEFADDPDRWARQGPATGGWPDRRFNSGSQGCAERPTDLRETPGVVRVQGRPLHRHE